MRILYLPGEYPFCYYYRGYLPGVYSNQMVVSDFMVLKKAADSQVVIEQAKKADVIVFQRPKDARTLDLALTLKKHGKKVIFENDDSYNLDKTDFADKLENEKQREVAQYFDKYTREFLKIADGAIASTPILGKEFAEINPKVKVLKNCIDPLDEYRCKPNTTGKFRVGFIGSVTTNDDYIHIKDQIKQLDERGDVTIVVMGVKYKDGSFNKFMAPDHEFWGSINNVEWHPYVPTTDYMVTVAGLALDLAIIPRKENYFNQCKSNVKFLEMSLLHIPVIAQGFSDGTSPYQGVDSEHLTVVTDNSQWYNKIIEIKENYPKFKKLAEEAHDYVLKDYNIKTYAQEWTKAIEELCQFSQVKV